MIAHLCSSTLFALVAIAAALCLRRQSARYRYALLLLAVLRFALPTSLLTWAGTALAPAAPTALVLGDLSRALLRFGASPSLPAPANAAHFPWLECLWLAGAAACAAVWLGRARRTVASVRPPAPIEAAALDRARRRIGGSLAVQIRIAAGGQAPGVRGIRRHRLILPDGLSAHLSAAELEAVIAHELVHIRRRDNLWAAAVHAIVSVFWFHPLLWWLESRLLAEREPACDEQVLASGAAPADYASGILKVCRTAFAGARGYAGATGADLNRRVEQILSLDLRRPSSRIPRAAAAAPAALALLLPLAGGFLRAQQNPPRVNAAPNSGVISIVVKGNSGVNHNQDMMRLSRILKASLPQPDPKLGRFGKWLAEDVVYLINPEEAAAFERLATDAERKKFIEQFWSRRDPTPKTARNEFKDEHYRRIRFASQRFVENVPGWQTGRGRVYILMGPPDQIEAQGPIQTWTYNNFGHSADRLIVTFKIPPRR